MKKIFYFVGLATITSLLIIACSKNQNVTPQVKSNPSFKSNSADVGNTIQSGKIFYWFGYLKGQPIKPGYDGYGFNYQAHIFNGSFANYYLMGLGFPPYTGDDASYLAKNPGAADTWVWWKRNVHLIVKWNDAYLSNKDRNGDGIPDRHYGFAGYKGSGAWFTYKESGIYTDNNGKNYHWNEFLKIAAVPVDAVEKGVIWYDADGNAIGLQQGQMAIVLIIYSDPNDPDGVYHGLYRYVLGHNKNGLGCW